ncbi:hypothetical protein FNV62_23110 [Streptomyces sp. RLB3-17]|uniref:hypothetical protein n=1 Tax=Streptomyces TaxID=1883 RepID=UPI001163F43B|nr:MULTISPECIES: hypothetical protein [unclassified Streptomyces]QDN98928.1 hypothetical protein FNV58_25650 [Streptomyces sp. RLB1-9]QDO20642.1 hypothetical protein FNV65_24145 [Streptomyces sp. S1A1-8]QDO30768.1 hypothetical protein FNV63_24165 [Streptomyces sp. S1A1-3]QDO40656.1 hypothetical protein FNV62_23110 [Streptomyces sp. RLB3-17]
MSEIAGQTGNRSAATAVVNESYSFACMRCGHGWEQSFEIEHHRDAEGGEFVMYVADGHVVPSPLSRPSCQNCDGHVVRIMRAGQVSSVQNSMHQHTHRPVQAHGEQAHGEAVDQPALPREPHHWHLSDLLHPFHHRKAG